MSNEGSFDDVYNGIHMEYERVVTMLEVAREMKSPKKLIKAMENAEAEISASLEAVNNVALILRTKESERADG